MPALRPDGLLMPHVYNLRTKHRIPIPRGTVYCGRGSPYGNPFIAGQHGSRDHVCNRFEEEVLPDLDVSALTGKNLVCWCAPLRCHCDAILEKANGDWPWALPEGLFVKDGKIMYHCRVCEEATEWPVEIEDFCFNDDHNVCGGSPRCLP